MGRRRGRRARPQETAGSSLEVTDLQESKEVSSSVIFSQSQCDKSEEQSTSKSPERSQSQSQISSIVEIDGRGQGQSGRRGQRRGRSSLRHSPRHSTQEDKDSGCQNDSTLSQLSISPIRKSHHGLSNDNMIMSPLCPLKTSTPIKDSNEDHQYEAAGEFPLIFNPEINSNKDTNQEGIDSAKSPLVETTENEKAASATTDPQEETGDNFFLQLDREDAAAQFSTPVRPTRPSPTSARRHNSLDLQFQHGQDQYEDFEDFHPRPLSHNNHPLLNNTDINLIDSPIFVPVDLNVSNSSEESQDSEKPYKLRPRNLFSKGVSIRRYNFYNENESEEENEAEDDDNDVLFYLDDSDAEGEVAAGYGERKRSSYSGIRGPKADAKALSLVTNCPVSVKWLVDNFEYHPGKSLPRGFVYDQYVILCDENGLEPVNAASFGKLIRSVFPGLKTRRLGTRGNSKYHYNGVYLKNSSPLRAILNLVRTQQGLTYDCNGRRGRRVRKCLEADAAKELLGQGDGDEFVDCSPDDYLGHPPELERPFADLKVEPEAIPAGLEAESVQVFENMYSTHCQALLKLFEKFELRAVFDEWKRFWRIRCNEPAASDKILNYKTLMSKATLFKVCSLEETQSYILSMDLSTYQFIMDILFPCLAKGMPITMVNGMRSFIKDVDFVFYKIMFGYPKKMVEIKLRSLRSFISMWNDYSRLNRMLKAAVTTMRSDDNIQAMQSELCRSINFEEIEEESSLYKKPNGILLQHELVLSFKKNLSNSSNYSVKSWGDWAETIAEKLINEGNRQVAEGETSKLANPFMFWKPASDRIMGAMVKGNAVSFGVFKGFLIWCDNLIKHITKINLSRTEGFVLPIFYYDHVLQTEGELKPGNIRAFPAITGGDLVLPGNGSSEETPTGRPKRLHRPQNLLMNIENGPFSWKVNPNSQEELQDLLFQDQFLADPNSDNVFYIDTSHMTEDEMVSLIQTAANFGIMPQVEDAENASPQLSSTSTPTSPVPLSLIPLSAPPPTPEELEGLEQPSAGQVLAVPVQLDEDTQIMGQDQVEQDLENSQEQDQNGE